MAQANSGNYDALVWVQDEIQQSLADALSTISRFIEAPNDPSILTSCTDQLGQTHGVVDMLGLAGAALLIKETLKSLSVLSKNEHKNTETIADTVLKSLLVLPNYLKLIGHDFPDHPLRLIETINELRTARSDSPLTATSLFTPNLGIFLPESISSPSSEVTINLSADKASHAFQV
jgi:chemosensory pili system protein ChpA (sensor histidine kinase/response regulator)